MCLFWRGVCLIESQLKGVKGRDHIQLYFIIGGWGWGAIFDSYMSVLNLGVLVKRELTVSKGFNIVAFF